MVNSEQEKTSIQGTLLMLDDVTPHVAVPVQAIRDREVIATVLSDETGKYQFVNLKPDRYQLRCQILGGYINYEENARGRKWSYKQMREHGREEAGNRVGHKESSLPTSGAVSSDKHGSLGDTLVVKPGKILKNIDFRFASFKKGTWRNYSCGLADECALAIHRTPDGVMWFVGGGVFRYDGKSFVNFTRESGSSSAPHSWNVYSHVFGYPPTGPEATYLLQRWYAIPHSETWQGSVGTGGTWYAFRAYGQSRLSGSES